MEQEAKVNKPFLKKVADKLVTAQQEIDELALQFALGKAEAREKFEDIKRELQTRISEFKKSIENSAAGILTSEQRQKLGELEVQLALGKAESIEAFEKQKKKILKALASAESATETWLASIKVPNHLQHDIETFKLKLEIVKLKFELKKFELTDVFKEHMSKAKRQVDKVTTSIQDTIKEKSDQYADFRNEVSIAHNHLREALRKLVK
ncbi:MAG TPA: hypothetical protein VFU05_17495 [Cyclobacteriaceae bacterium]|nr:hypothetical protein [Cyclobacteriaceae bacterium]